MSESVLLPEKRTAVLYSRISQANKDFIIALSKKRDVSEAVVVDWLLSKARKAERAGDAKKSRRSA